MELFKKRNATEMDLTKGNLFWKMPRFIIPLALTTIFQLLYTTIDLWTVAQFGGGSTSMAAIGSNGSLISLIITVLVSLATGANVVISSAKGADNQKKAEKVLHTAFVVAVVGGLLAGVLGFFFAPQILKLMDTPASIIDKASLYLRVYFCGVQILMIYNFGSQMLRALGDSKRPLYILTISGIVNVVFDFIFVKFFNMDVLGVALATVFSEMVSATLVILWFRYSKTTYVNLDFKKLHVDKESLKEILRIGLPAGLQGLAFTIPNVLIQSSLYTIEDYFINGVAISQDEIVTGAAASGQIEGYGFALINACSVGLVSFVGQNFGAKQEHNIKKSYWNAFIWTTIFWLFIVTVCAFLYRPLLSIFITDSEGIIVDNAIASGRQRLYIMMFTYILDGIMDINSGYLRGMKKSLPPAIITLTGCTISRIVFLLTLFKLPMFHTIFWLYAAFPISWIIVDIVYIPVILTQQKKVFKSFNYIEVDYGQADN